MDDDVLGLEIFCWLETLKWITLASLSNFRGFSSRRYLRQVEDRKASRGMKKPPRSRIRWDTYRGGLKINQLLPRDPD
jgi:hypothetical protein